MSPFIALLMPVVSRLRVGEFHSLESSETRDVASQGIDVDREALDAGAIADKSAARTAVRQRPPLVSRRVVVDIREETESSSVRARLARRVQTASWNNNAVDEGGLG